jgi:hypothetical protein
MAKEYRVDCVLTEREKALLVALRSNIYYLDGVSGEIFGALKKITSDPDSVYDNAVSKAMFSALSSLGSDAIEIPDFIVPEPIVESPLNDGHTITVNPDGSIKVGGQTVQFDALERVYEEAKRAKGAN